MEDNLKKINKIGRHPQKNGRRHKKIKMEDDLNKNENGRRPQFFLKIKDDLNFLTLEDNFIVLKIEDNFIFI